MVRQARRLGQATAQLIQSIKGNIMFCKFVIQYELFINK